MSPPQKEKKSSSLPCEVFFACTRCGSRSRTVPQLLTHYKTVHKEEIANGTISNKDPAPDGKQEETIPAEGHKSQSQTKDIAKDKKGGSSKKGSKEKKDDESDVVYVEGSKKPAKPSCPVITHPEKDCVITRKRNVPLGMLEGKKNSLMVIFQHSDQNKPLPEGSSFKLRNTGGEQTYLVVANVDVDIIEQGKPAQGKRARGRPAKKAKTGK
ncbi:uncharacterized protein LOC121416991 [Lytechinus variegatus]|uniref:uncharacterized protein LOC121416991 n=1 Tax=Lytechinus variegatus TaxID=7654 RepID=UPI001BB226EC|nr:uncharacterized protein LOC121416991 [Lytechinus variegatus]